jgi:putative aldouronate transport system permease protein
MKRLGRRKRISVFDAVNTLLVILITFIVAYPLYFCVIASLSNPKEVAAGNTLFWIKGFTLDAYKLILEEDQLWIGYRNTIIYTIGAVLYRLFLTIPAAYVMSKEKLPFRGFLAGFFFIPMYISGGMIPEFLLIKKLGLLDNPLVMIVGAGVSAYNLIVCRQYFSTNIHSSLYEAAYIDGASEWRAFTSIALPLAKPIIAVMALYIGVGAWNNYHKALLYIYDKDYYPLQLVLRNILNANQLDLSNITGSGAELADMVYRANMAQGMKYSIVIVASLPLIIAYPFLQKYFVKGTMVGSVKG